ncbi:MAG: hypothetical protein HY320_03705 [Armatimonadetes bacterium]|nr:hypothetical protein [Armatimonadota bacterium]
MREDDYLRPARIYADKGNYAQALHICQRGLGEHPDSLPLLELAAQAALLLQDEHQHATYALRVANLNLAQDDRMAARAVCQFCRESNLTRARMLLETAWRRFPRSASLAAADLVYCCYAHQMPEARYLPLAYLNAGDVLAQSGLPMAVAVWTWGLDHYPEDPSLHERLAHAYTQLGDTSRARLHLDWLQVHRAQQAHQAARSAQTGAILGGTTAVAGGAVGVGGAVAGTAIGALGLSLTASGAAVSATGCGCLIGLPVMALGVLLCITGVAWGVLSAAIGGLLGLLGITTAGIAHYRASKGQNGRSRRR